VWATRKGCSLYLSCGPRAHPYRPRRWSRSPPAIAARLSPASARALAHLSTPDAPPIASVSHAAARTGSGGAAGVATPPTKKTDVAGALTRSCCTTSSTSRLERDPGGCRLDSTYLAPLINKISISYATANVGCPVPLCTVALRPAISVAAEESALWAYFAELAMMPRIVPIVLLGLLDVRNDPQDCGKHTF